MSIGSKGYYDGVDLDWQAAADEEMNKRDRSRVQGGAASHDEKNTKPVRKATITDRGPQRTPNGSMGG